MAPGGSCSPASYPATACEAQTRAVPRQSFTLISKKLCVLHYKKSHTTWRKARNLWFDTSLLPSRPVLTLYRRIAHLNPPQQRESWIGTTIMSRHRPSYRSLRTILKEMATQLPHASSLQRNLYDQSILRSRQRLHYEKHFLALMQRWSRRSLWLVVDELSQLSMRF